MAILHKATIEPSKLDLIDGWIGGQRWYGKGHAPVLTQVGSYRFDDPAGEVGMEVILVQDSSGDDPVVYQVPLTYRSRPLEGAQEWLVGTTEHSVLGTRYVYDGCHDPLFVTELLRTILTGGTQAEVSYAPGTDGAPAGPLPPSVQVQGSGSRDRVMPQVTGTRVLTGEQSNTSMVIDTEAPDGTPKPLTIKLFRIMQDGLNPDVQLQSALSAAGSDRVPNSVGYLTGRWEDDVQPGGHAAGHLAFAQEFLPDVQDAWREAVKAAKEGTDWSGPARMLGRATAEIHQALARALPTLDPSPTRIRGIVATMRERFDQAARASDEVEQHRSGFEAMLARAEKAQWPALQRIHGDYHLGQVLDAPHRGWVVVDFEGEPLRPLHERNEVDSPLRDVAGMLRSFDYAVASTSRDRVAWSNHCRHAFLEGYSEASGHDLLRDRDLLDTFEADKACYEVVYESRNRPDWIGIPLSALGLLIPAVESESAGQAATPAEQPPQEPPHPGVDHGAADAILAGTHTDPHSVLGGQVDSYGPLVRALRPMAASVKAELPDGQQIELSHDYEGFWSARLPGSEVPDYRLLTDYGDGYEHRADDPYRFLPTLGDIDLHLIGEGRHEQLWNVLGARLHTYDGPQGAVHGTSFAVWAPNAIGVRIIGDFNYWDGTQTPMRRLGGTGVWEIFVPDVGAGTRYKFSILCADHVWRSKADPMARYSETSPATASIVHQTSYDWGDEEWMTARANRDVHNAAMSIYEVHLGSWRQGLSYRDMAEHLVNYVKDLGFTHVELMPVMEHPYPPSWGYHVTGYYATNSRFGDPDDFRYLVDTLHQNGIGVILDWVPGHFATDEWALARFDGTPLYEHPDPRRGWNKDWGSYIFNFGRHEVRNFLVANGVYWLQEFHCDGLRVDGVASMLYLDYSRGPGEWEPNIFGGNENLEAVQMLQETTATAYRRVPGTVMIAEESTSWPGVTRPTSAGGLGFGFKWNMGWMHDTLDYVAQQPIYRQYDHNKMTFSMVYAYSEQYVLPISHDEVVHGKGSLLRKIPGNRWEQLATLRALLGYMWSHPGKQLLFMGCEFAQESEWADGRSLDWWLLDQPAHWGVHALVKDINRFYAEHGALWELDNDASGFQWINADDSGGNTFSFLRYGRPREDGSRDIVAVIANFSGSEHRDVRIGLPVEGAWQEAINTDGSFYGGGGEGNLGQVIATEDPANGQPYSAAVTLPALSTIFLTPTSPTD